MLTAIKNYIFRIPIADIFLSRRKREAESTQADLTTTTTAASAAVSTTLTSSLKTAAAVNTPKMVKIGAVINVLPKATTTTTVSAATATTVYPSSPNENELLGFELSTSSSTKRLPKVVSNDDLFPDSDEETAAKQFGSIDYADKKLGKNYHIPRRRMLL